MTETETIDELGHSTVIDEAVFPTCSQAGLSEGAHCSRCEEVLTKQQVLAPVDHSFTVHGQDVCAEETCQLFHSCLYCDLTLLIPLEERYFYRRLSATEQANVAAVYNALISGEQEFIRLPHAMANAEEEADAIANILFYSCPELIMLSTNESMMWWRGDDELKYQCCLTVAEYESCWVELFALLFELNKVTKELTDWEKSKLVYDLIMESTIYECAMSDAVNPHEGSCLGPLGMGYARCQGYVNAYQLCMWAVGLECYAVTGVAGDDNERHAWTFTKLDEAYYLSDVTWDDSEDTPITYGYFNVCESDFPKHTVDTFWVELGMPVCDRKDMSLFAVNGTYVEAEADLKSEIFGILNECYQNGTPAYFKLESQEHFNTVIDATLWRNLMVEWATRNGLAISWSKMWWEDTLVVCIELIY